MSAQITVDGSYHAAKFDHTNPREVLTILRDKARDDRKAATAEQERHENAALVHKMTAENHAETAARYDAALEALGPIPEEVAA